MEASENQLNFDESGGGTVRAIGDRLVIESLTVHDERAAKVVRERANSGAAAPETVAKAIEIGTRVLDSEETAVNVDYVRRELEGGLGALDEKLNGTLTEGADALAERLTETFGAERSDSVQAQIKEIVTAEARLHRESLMQTLTSEDASNPLVAMQLRIGKALVEAEERHRSETQLLREGHQKQAVSMQQEMGRLREELARLHEREDADERVAEAEAAGTRKGITFEERVHSAIERIADTRGDCATHTGAEGAEGGGKKGDSLVEVGAASGPATARIVFECKDKRLSKKAAWDELNAAMDARAAAFAVLVVAGEENVPAGRETLHEYGGNKMIVSVDRDEPDSLILEVAYRLAAARVAMARDRELVVDAVAVRDTASEAIAMLKAAQAIRSNLTGIKTSSDRAREGLNLMVDQLQERLERIEVLVAEASAEAEEAPEALE